MKTSVYISNDILRIAVGTEKSVSRLLSLRLRSESLINGLIVNEAAFADEMNKLWSSYSLSRKISVVMNSSQFITRSLSVQTSSVKKIPQLVRNEFFGTDQLANPLYDYRIYDRRDGRVYLLATAVNEDYVKSLTGIFLQAGITVESLTTPVYAAMSFFDAVKEPADSCQIALIYDNSMLTCQLIVNGKFYYSRGGRVLAENGTPGFITEVSSSVTSMLQFRSTERITQPITSVQLFGFSSKVDNELKQSLTALTGLNIAAEADKPSISMPEDDSALINDEDSPLADIGTCLFAIGDLLA